MSAHDDAAPEAAPLDVAALLDGPWVVVSTKQAMHDGSVLRTFGVQANGLCALGKTPCCWPLGDPGRAGFRFCSERAVQGKPHCPAHAAPRPGPGRRRRRRRASAPGLTRAG